MPVRAGSTRRCCRWPIAPRYRSAPPSFDDAKNSPAPSYFLPSCFAGTRLRLSIQAENTDPSASSPSATKRWLSLFDVIGFGSAKLLPPSADLRGEHLTVERLVPEQRKRQCDAAIFLDDDLGTRIRAPIEVELLLRHLNRRRKAAAGVASNSPPRSGLRPSRRATAFHPDAKAGVTFDAQRNTTSSHAASEAC